MDYYGKQDGKRFCIFVPGEIIRNRYCGQIYGYYHSETEVFNITGTTYDGVATVLGAIADTNTVKSDKSLIGYWKEDNLVFLYSDKEYEIIQYELKKKLFSRNQGILETTWMQNQKAVIIGCGSVGSFIAVELARSGVAQYVLIDSDIVEYDNLCRHQCGIPDVGTYKVDAIKKRILNINPSALVIPMKTTLENQTSELLDGIIDKNTIIISCADNRSCDVLGNQIAVSHSVPFVSVGFWERACVGEIFYQLPFENMPCYKSAFGNTFNSNQDVNRKKFYTMNTDLKNIYYSPGIAADIDFVTIIAVKLILDIFNRENKNYITRVLSYLSAYTLICNCNDPRVGGDVLEIFSYPLQITKNLKVDYNTTICRSCSLKDQCLEETCGQF